MSRREWRSLVILFSLAVVGHLIRGLLLGAGAAPGAVTLFDKNTDGNVRAQKALVEHLMQPIGAQERIDADQASAAEFRRLPGVGPALAARIVADRESLGAFGGMAGLSRVPGIGPATQTRLAPHLSFSGQPSQPTLTPTGMKTVDLNQASVSELDALPGIGAAKARAIVAFRDSAGPFRQITDLLKVTGMTRKLVDRISPQVVLQ